MATSLELSTRRDPDGTPVVTAVGEIDMSNADSFLDALGQAAAPRRRPVRRGPDRRGVPGQRRRARPVRARRAVQLIASPLLAPVLAISGLSDVTSAVIPGASRSNVPAWESS